MNEKNANADPGEPGLEGFTGGSQVLRRIACRLKRKGVEGRMEDSPGSRRGAIESSSAGLSMPSGSLGDDFRPFLP